MNMGDFASKLPGSVLSLGRVFQDINYEFGIYGLPKQVSGVQYRCYDFLTPSSDILLQKLLSRASPGEVVFDAGANVGHYALPTAALGCQVHAFEPDPEAFERLQRNVRLNDGVDVKSYNIGLSDSSDTLDLYRSSLSTLSTFTQPNESDVIDVRETTVRTIDGLIEEDELPPPDHVKIDVEGFGPQVLEGARRTICDHQPVIYFEPHGLENGGKREEELRSFFRQLDYRITEFGYPWMCVAAEEETVRTDA